MKKTISFVMGTLLILTLCFSSFAHICENRIYANAITVEAGEQFSVPIRIENNQGFMGFALIIHYDGQAVAPVSVAKGSMLSGMFNSSIETSTEDAFKIVFSATQDCKIDGELCTIVFCANQKFSGSQIIEISYSEEDTFNEQWEPVAMHCEDVSLVITQNGTTTSPISETEPETQMPTIPSVSDPESETEHPKPTRPETQSTTIPAISPSSIKDSQMLHNWYKSLPIGLRIVLAALLYPAILILSLVGR